MTVSKINTPRSESNRDVIDMLEELLKEAKDGDIDAIAVAKSNSITGMIDHNWGGYYVPYTMAGCLEKLKLKILGADVD